MADTAGQWHARIGLLYGRHIAGHITYSELQACPGWQLLVTTGKLSPDKRRSRLEELSLGDFLHLMFPHSRSAELMSMLRYCKGSSRLVL